MITFYDPQILTPGNYLWKYVVKEFHEKIVNIQSHELLNLLNLIFNRFDFVHCNEKNTFLQHSSNPSNIKQICRENMINVFYSCYLKTRRKILIPKELPSPIMWDYINEVERYIKILINDRKIQEEKFKGEARPLFDPNPPQIADWEYTVCAGNLGLIRNLFFYWILLKDTEFMNWARLEWDFYSILQSCFQFRLTTSKEIVDMVNEMRKNDHIFTRFSYTMHQLPIVKIIILSDL